MYADDTQLNHSFYYKESVQDIDSINLDLRNMFVGAAHSSKINSSKSSVVIFGNKK